MTLNDIIYSALRMLERGNDTQTVDKYRKVFTDYANTAIGDIAYRIKPTFIEEVTLDEKGRLDLNSLTRNCIRIESIKNSSGSEMAWSEIATGIIQVTNGEGATVEMRYRYRPVRLSSTTDVPQLPAFTHDIIPYFVVACHNRDKNDTPESTYYFDMFNRELAQIHNDHYGDSAKNKLINLGW